MLPRQDLFTILALVTLATNCQAGLKKSNRGGFSDFLKEIATLSPVNACFNCTVHGQGSLPQHFFTANNIFIHLHGLLCIYSKAKLLLPETSSIVDSFLGT